tara:strand:- start:88275 stop:89639 length:1365 start_codon:yes stop_codon:yes gene_type:complete
MTTTTKLPELRFQRLKNGRIYARAQFPGEDKPRRFGRADSADALASAHREFDATLARWLANGRAFPKAPAVGFTIAEMCDGYLAHQDQRHGAGWATRGGNGKRTVYALRGETTGADGQTLPASPLRALYGTEPAAEFGPMKLKTVRDAWVASCCASEINLRVGSIRAAFDWAVENELVPDSVAYRLSKVKGLKGGEFGVAEGEGRDAVAFEAVLATLPHLPPVIDVVVELLARTGARPKELLTMTRGDIDTTDDERWVAVLKQHKTAKKGKARVLVFEKAAQRALAPYMDRAPEVAMFRPAEGFAEGNRRRRAAGSRPKLYGNDAVRYERERKERLAAGKAPRVFSETYDSHALRKAVERGIERANAAREEGGLAPLPRWTPYQIRHAVATEADVLVDRETAAAQLGHASTTTTRRYSHDDVGKAVKASSALAGRPSLALLDEAVGTGVKLSAV